MRALNRRDRLSAIGAACATFNHDISSIHDDEIQNHFADVILSKHLSFLLLQEQHNPDRNKLKEEEFKKYECGSHQNYPRSQFEESDEEIGYTCSALEMVFRGSASVLAKSFEKNGPELLDLLLAVIYRRIVHKPFIAESGLKEASTISFSGWFKQEMSRENILKSSDLNLIEQSNTPANFADMSIQKATKIMCHLARVGSIVEPMAHHPGILRVLKDIIDSCNQNSLDQSTRLPNTAYESCINCLWILGNLACAPGNMDHMMSYPGLSKTLLNVINSCTVSHDQHVMSPSLVKSIASAGQAIRIFLNLSWTNTNKILMCQNHEIIDEITKVVSILNHGQSKKVNSLISTAKQHAIGALRNMAGTTSKNEKLLLCQYNNGLVLRALNEIITRKLQSEETSEVWKDDLVMKERAIATIFNLICAATVNIIASDADLFTPLCDLSKHSENDSGDIPKLLEKTLSKMKENVTPDMDCYESISGLSEKQHLNTDSLTTDAKQLNKFIHYASM